MMRKDYTIAQKFLSDLKNLQLKFDHVFMEPLLNIDENKDIVLEWWKNEKKLTVYISSEKITYIKIINSYISDMKDGIFKELNPKTYMNLFGWLAQ